MDDLWETASKDLRVPVVPYLEQDNWGCEREEKNVDIITMELCTLLYVRGPERTTISQSVV